MKDPNFSFIHLESADLEDFGLIFTDEHKIICESKYREEKFSFPQLKDILDKIFKKNKITEKDKILIICKNIDDNFISKVKNIILLKLKKKKKNFFNKF